jgi:histidinol-phosphate aminotransferase
VNFERPNIRAMNGYISGEQPQGNDTIKLNTNENPYPPSPAVNLALQNLDISALRRYPPPTASSLRNSVANLHKLNPEQVLITNGGDELLRLLLATFVSLDETIATASPSYTLYDVLAAAHGCRMKHFVMQNWILPIDIAQQLNAASIKLCFIVNPNAPSGVLIPVEKISQLAEEFKGILVVDEAYVDFVNPNLAHDCVKLINRFDNLVILRTLSKGYSLAGLRMAYGLGQESLIQPMQYKTKDSYNTDLIAQTLAKAAFEDQTYAQDTWQKVRSERVRVRAELESMGFTSPASESNFLLASVPTTENAEDLYLQLKTAGILVRYFKVPQLDNTLRITIGTPEENNCLLSTLSKLLQKKY